MKSSEIGQVRNNIKSRRQKKSIAIQMCPLDTVWKCVYDSQIDTQLSQLIRLKKKLRLAYKRSNINKNKQKNDEINENGSENE